MRALLFALFLAQAVPLDAVRFEQWTPATRRFLAVAPHFLSREELLALPVEAPSANSSDATRRDLDALLAMQAARTGEQIARIKDHREYPAVCAAVLAAAHRQLDHAPYTKALLRDLDRDMTFAVFHAKERFARARPHQLDARIQPIIAVPAHPAYPSGHALQGYLVARVLAGLFPQSRDALMRAGIEIGHEREIAGLHYPSDSAASRNLGEAIYLRLTKNVQFQTALDLAKHEWPVSRGAEVSGRYVNCVYEYEVTLPAGVVGFNEPAADHGFGIDLRRPSATSGQSMNDSRYLYVDASRDHGETAFSEPVPNGEQTQATLDGVAAIRTTAQSGDQLRAQVVTRHDGKAYVISLVTHDAYASRDLMVLDSVVAGFHFLGKVAVARDCSP